MLLLRARLPNRPGALGAVATALGAIGADINLVEIVKDSDAGLCEFILDLPPDQTVASLVAACDSLPGVQVESVRNYPRGGGIELDVELHRRMAAGAPPAGEILATAAPLVFRAHWSLVLQVSGMPRARFSSPGAPHLHSGTIQRFGPFDTVHRVALEAGWMSGWEAHHAVVAPLPEQQAVIIARRGEPPFFPSELARLAHLVGSAETTEMLDPSRSGARPSTAHRTPIAAPLYRRGEQQKSTVVPGTQ